MAKYGSIRISSDDFNKTILAEPAGGMSSIVYDLCSIVGRHNPICDLVDDKTKKVMVSREFANGLEAFADNVNLIIRTAVDSVFSVKDDVIKIKSSKDDTIFDSTGAGILTIYTTMGEISYSVSWVF